jgi:hypothetical protein
VKGEGIFQALLTSSIYGDKWSTSRPGPIWTLWGEKKNKNPLSVPSIELQLLGRQTRSLVATLTKLSGCYILILKCKEINEAFVTRPYGRVKKREDNIKTDRRKIF